MYNELITFDNYNEFYMIIMTIYTIEQNQLMRISTNHLQKQENNQVKN